MQKAFKKPDVGQIFGMLLKKPSKGKIEKCLFDLMIWARSFQGRGGEKSKKNGIILEVRGQRRENSSHSLSIYWREVKIICKNISLKT